MLKKFEIYKIREMTNTARKKIINSSHEQFIQNEQEKTLTSAAVHIFYHERVLNDFYLDFEGLVCMAALCWSDPISMIPKNEQLLREKMTFAYVHTARQIWLNRISSSRYM